MSLVLSSPLDSLLKRRTDGASILEGDKHFHKKVTLERALKFTVMRRDEGLEKRYHWLCKECKCLIAYQSHDCDDMVGGPGTAAKEHQLYVSAGAVVGNA